MEFRRPNGDIVPNPFTATVAAATAFEASFQDVLRALDFVWPDGPPAEVLRDGETAAEAFKRAAQHIERLRDAVEAEVDRRLASGR